MEARNAHRYSSVTLERVSDITLGDSWGTEYKEEEMNGISLVLIQSEKGKELADVSDLVLKDVDLDNAVAHNHQLSHPSTLSPKREKFLSLIKTGFRLTPAHHFTSVPLSSQQTRS